MAIVFVNNFETFLGAGIASSSPGTTGFTVTVAAGTGSAFPAIAAPDVAFLTVIEGNNIEIMQVTAHTAGSDSFTVTRGFEGVGQSSATAVAYTTAATVSCRLNRAALNTFAQMDAIETITGPWTFTTGLVKFTTAPVTMSGGVTIDTGVTALNAPVTASATILINAQPVISGSMRMISLGNNPAPVTGSLIFYPKTIAGRHIPKWVAPSGVDYAVQPSLFANQILNWRPYTGSIPGTAWGTMFLNGGTVSHPAITTGSSTPGYTSIRRTNFTNVVTTTNQTLGLFTSGSAHFMRGPVLNTGGFFCVFRFGFSLIPTGTRVFVGLSTQTSASVVSSDPSTTAASMIGLGMDLADTNLTIFSKASTVAITKTAIGAGLAKANNTLYDLFLFSTPGGQDIKVRLDSTDKATGVTSTLIDTTLSANIPRNAEMMGMHCAMSNGTANTTAATVGIDIISIYGESDF